METELEIKYILELVKDKVITIEKGTERILNLFNNVTVCSDNSNEHH
jgi:hypothetical protein